jgi:TolA-binding protein
MKFVRMKGVAVRRIVAGTFVAGLALVASSGCSTVKSLKNRAYESTRGLVTRSYDDPTANDKMASAERAFLDKNYSTARTAYYELANNTLNPVLLTEKARYLEGECYRLEGKYPEAVETYNKMLLDHPTGAYRERACQEMFKIADYWLDDTREEIQADQAGTNMYAYKAKRFFNYDRSKPTLDREGVALKALENVQLNDITGPTADKALFWCGFVNFYRGNYQEADHYFRRRPRNSRSSARTTAPAARFTMAKKPPRRCNSSATRKARCRSSTTMIARNS